MSEKKIIPALLRPGDTVAIISPSYAIDEEKVAQAEDLLEGWGLRVKRARNALKRVGPFAGSDEERLSDLREAVEERSVKAVFCSRGGYGLMRIIDKVNYAPLKKYPKWFIGYSDITVLHLWLSRVCGIASLHAEMPLHFAGDGKSAESLSTLRDALFYGNLSWEWQGEALRGGTVSGEFTGGNLSLLCSLTGTKAEPDTRGKILFIEDTGEHYYTIDRMLTSLKLAGKLKHLAALVTGGFTDMHDGKIPWGMSVKETIAGIVKEYNYPLFTGCPAGHTADNRALVMGCRAEISSEGDRIKIRFRY